MKNRDLHKKILTDRAGVLNWIIEGAEQVIKERNIFVSDECENTKKQFIKETDSVAMFEEKYIIEELKVSTYLETVDFSYSEYKTFCLNDGRKNPLGRTNFSKRMEAIGFEKSIKNTGKYLEKKYL